jgi:hypothetical protein
VSRYPGPFGQNSGISKYYGEIETGRRNYVCISYCNYILTFSTFSHSSKGYVNNSEKKTFLEYFTVPNGGFLKKKSRHMLQYTVKYTLTVVIHCPYSSIVFYLFP